MQGMHRVTGKPIDGLEHLAQSIRDILTTPIGTRLMRRDYGSLLPELVDAPANNATRVLLTGATAMALARWEPRIRLTRADVSYGPGDGKVNIRLEGHRTDVPASNSLVRLTIPLKGQIKGTIQ